jgi:tetratricopeptide (TPR) repeat protein
LKPVIAGNRWVLLIAAVVLVSSVYGCSGSAKGAKTVPVVEPTLTLEQRMIKYQDELRENPENVEALYQMGNVYFDMGDFTEALQHYQRAIERDANHLPARANLAGVLQEMGEFDDAIAQYRTVVEKSPNDARAHSNLGNALYVSGKVTEAVDEFRKALKLDPENPHAHYNLGVAFADEGYYDEALVEWRKVVEVAAQSQVGEAAQRNIEGIERARQTYEKSPQR